MGEEALSRQCSNLAKQNSQNGYERAFFKRELHLFRGVDNYTQIKEGINLTGERLEREPPPITWNERGTKRSKIGSQPANSSSKAVRIQDCSVIFSSISKNGTKIYAIG